MNSINYDIKQLETCIKELRSLSKKLEKKTFRVDGKEEECQGDVWEEIGDIFGSVDDRKEGILKLIESTANYLEQSKEAITEADSDIAGKI